MCWQITYNLYYHCLFDFVISSIVLIQRTGYALFYDTLIFSLRKYLRQILPPFWNISWNFFSKCTIAHNLCKPSSSHNSQYHHIMLATQARQLSSLWLSQSSLLRILRLFSTWNLVPIVVQWYSNIFCTNFLNLYFK